MRHLSVSEEIAERAVNRELPFMVDDATIDLDGLANSLAPQCRLGAIIYDMIVIDVINPEFAVAANAPQPEAAL